MNKLDTAKRTQIVAALVEGNSIKGTARMCGVSHVTVLKLLIDLGKACKKYHDEHVKNVSCRRIQCDEIWSFCYAKHKNVPPEFEGQFGYGDCWTWTALCADSKLMVYYHIADRSLEAAKIFISDLASRLKHRVQLTTDGHRVYVDAVEDAFGADIDYAMLVKLYGNDAPDAQKKYSPAICTGTRTATIKGNPDKTHISTSYVERQNLTMRMSMRRFTRLTNAFSKKIENLECAVALHYMYYNFARIHQTLRVTPAMEAGLSDHVWEIEEIINLL